MWLRCNLCSPGKCGVLQAYVTNRPGLGPIRGMLPIFDSILPRHAPEADPPPPRSQPRARESKGEDIISPMASTRARRRPCGRMDPSWRMPPSPPPSVPSGHKRHGDFALSLRGPGAIAGPLLATSCSGRQSGRGRACRFEATLSDSKPSVLYRDARPHADGSRIGSQGHMGAGAQGRRGQMRRGPTSGW